MYASSSKPETNWEPCQARVTGCRRTWDTWFVDEASPDEGGSYQLAKYVITFSYTAQGRLYTDSYTAGSPGQIGEILEIGYNPGNPQENTGSDKQMNLPVRIAAWSVGIAIAILIIHLLPAENW